YTRWHHVLWWNNTDPDVYLQQNTQYIQDTMAVSRYMPLTPDETFLASLPQSFPPLSNGNQTPQMGATGAQEGIGPLPRWTSVYIVDPDVRAYNWMLANTDALGAYSIHYRDQATGWPISIQKHPYATLVGWSDAAAIAKQQNAKGAAYQGDLLPPPGNTGNPNQWDNAHQPAESYVPYMVTGSYYYMSELAFGASQNELWSDDVYRGYAKGLIDQSHSQVRGKAWTLRNMANAAWLLPDDYPLKAEFNADVENSLADWNTKYTNNPSPANSLHVTADSTVPYNGALAPWQHNFLTWSAGHAAELGFAGAAQFRDWLAQFEIGLMTDWQANPTQGYCWLEASAYTIVAKNSAGNWLPSYTAMYAATFPTLVGLSCNTPAMVATMAKLPGNPNPGRVGEMYGYAFSATGYPANLQIALATAADTGLPNAQTAWGIFDSRSVKPLPPNDPAYNDYPNFALWPRSAQADGTVPPPTMPPPSNPPPSNPPPSDPPPSNPPPTNPPPTNPPPTNPPPKASADGAVNGQQHDLAGYTAGPREVPACSRSAGIRCLVEVVVPLQHISGQPASRQVPAAAAARPIPASELTYAAPAVKSPSSTCGSGGAPTAPCRVVSPASLWTISGWLNLLMQTRATMFTACSDTSDACGNNNVRLLQP
ncbi:MAG: hypothetical protein ACREPS_06275, partial [Rhodanobacteraceae bacterium]